MTNGEQVLRANGVELCAETFGAAGDPAILLIHGASASMLWWEEELCGRIAAAGRYAIRFDNRDTGRSTSFPPARPGYALSDMVDDAVGLLDALGIERAHLVGRSMGGGIAAAAAVRHAERVATLTLVTTSPGGPGLPPMSEELVASTSSGAPDPADTAAVVAYVTGLVEAYSGPSPYFDAEATRALVEHDVARTRDIAACLVNHFVIEIDEEPRLGETAAPALVVHGERDPVFPLAHGEALRDRIPVAELLVLERAGHELPPQLWDVFVPALTRHTAAR